MSKIATIILSIWMYGLIALLFTSIGLLIYYKLTGGMVYYG